jgi:alpha-ketoglutarate-dependent taurine dioxygenase
MDTFQAHHAELRGPGWQARIAAHLRDQGLVTFSGITSRDELVAFARQWMTIRPHRDAGPDGVTVITGTQAKGSGYAAFTDAELIPHTDGSSMPDPPGLLLLACQQPASEGGTTLIADGACIAETLAEQNPGALRSLSALSNTRWLHGRDRYSGHRVMLRIPGDLLPGTDIMPGFPSPSPASGQAPQAA